MTPWQKLKLRQAYIACCRDLETQLNALAALDAKEAGKKVHDFTARRRIWDRMEATHRKLVRAGKAAGLRMPSETM